MEVSLDISVYHVWPILNYQFDSHRMSIDKSWTNKHIYLTIMVYVVLRYIVASQKYFWNSTYKFVLTDILFFIYVPDFTVSVTR